MDQMKIGKFIAALRKEKGLTQEQLGEKLGVTNKTISRWENGNYMPDVEMLSLLSKEFGVSINELIAGERLLAEDFKKAADDNLVTALNNSTFTLKEKIAFFKKKWLHEHISTIVLCVVAWIGIIIWTAVKLRGSDSYALLGAIGSMLAILFYVVLYNRMMVYVENPHIGQRQTRKPKRKTLNITIISKEKITYVYLQNRDFNGQHKMVFG